MQFITWPILIVLFNLSFNLKILGRKNLKGLSGPLLIIANHKTFFDSFIFRVVLGFNSKLLPLRFMGAINFQEKWLNFLAKIKIISFIYKIFGVFLVIHGEGLEKALEMPKKILENNGVVLIYPEGKMIYEDYIGKFKRGALVLAQTTGITVLPVSLKKMNESKKFRKKFIVNFGKTFVLKQNLSYEEGAEYMRSIVVKLYNDEI